MPSRGPMDRNLSAPVRSVHAHHAVRRAAPELCDDEVRLESPVEVHFLGVGLQSWAVANDDRGHSRASQHGFHDDKLDRLIYHQGLPRARHHIRLRRLLLPDCGQDGVGRASQQWRGRNFRLHSQARGSHKDRVFDLEAGISGFVDG